MQIVQPQFSSLICAVATQAFHIVVTNESQCDSSVSLSFGVALHQFTRSGLALLFSRTRPGSVGGIRLSRIVEKHVSV